MQMLLVAAAATVRLAARPSLHPPRTPPPLCTITTETAANISSTSELSTFSGVVQPAATAPPPDAFDFMREASSDPDELRRRFKELSRTEHPDISGADDAVERFQALNTEYQRLLGECRTAEAREDLKKVWLGVLAGAAVAAGAADPSTASALLLGSVGGYSFFTSGAADEFGFGEYAAAAKEAAQEVVPEPVQQGVGQLWEKVSSKLEPSLKRLPANWDAVAELSLIHI